MVQASVTIKVLTADKDMKMYTKREVYESFAIGLFVVAIFFAFLMWGWHNQNKDKDFALQQCQAKLGQAY